MPLRIERFQMQWRTSLERFCERWSQRCGVPNASPAAAREFLQIASVDPKREVLLGFTGEEIGACGFLVFERGLSRCVAQTFVASAAECEAGLAEALFAATLELVGAAGLVRLHIPALPNSELASRLEAEAFRAVRRYVSWELRPSDFTQSSRTSLSLRTYAGPVDAAALADLQNACFRGDFGYEPNSPPEISDYVNRRGGPENLLIANAAQGTEAAYVWVSLASEPAGERTGRIEMTGVHPDCRRRGYGRQIVCAGVAELLGRRATRVVLDVDSVNLPAVQLYRSLGFRERFSYSWFEKLAG